MQYKNKIGLYFFSIILLLGAGLFTVNKTFAETTIPVSIDTSLQVVQRLLVTIDGGVLGTQLADFNTGGNIIFYVPIKDGAGNRYITSESDPSFASSSAAGIHALNISQWNSAYTRGNHALMGYLTGEVDPLWSLEKSSYYTKTDVDNLLSSSVGGLKYKGVWDYSTGALPSEIAVGYFFKVNTEGNHNGLHLYVGDMIIANTTINGLTETGNWDIISNSISETDPVFAASIAAAISATQVSQWNDAYSRGNHALMGYLTGELDPLWSLEKTYYYTKAQIDAKNYLTSFTELDPAWNADKGNYYTKNDIDNKFEVLSGSIGGITGEIDPEWNAAKSNYYTKFAIDNKGFLTGFTEADHIFAASIAGQIGSSDITKWDSAYNWIQTNSGNNNYYSKSEIDTKGFLTGFDETDPIWNSEKANYYSKSTIDAKGFLTGFDETDPIWNANSGNYYTKTAIDAKGFLTSFTELDPIFSASVAAQIGFGDLALWDSAVNWISANSGNALYFYNNSGNYYTKSDIDTLISGINGGSSSSIQYRNKIGNNLSYMSGNVGIGTTAPNLSLEVNGKTAIGDSITNTRLTSSIGPRSMNLIDTNAAVRIWRYIAGAGNAAQIELGVGTNDTFFNNDVWGIGAFYQDGFSIYKRTGVDYRYFNINSSGNVGIGTTTPSQKLDVAGNIVATNGNINLSSVSYGYMLAGATGLSLSNTKLQLGIAATFTSLALYTNGSEKVSVDTNGNVGIGTTSPTAKLDIGGTTQVSAAIYPTAGITSNTDNIQSLQLQNKNAGANAEMRFIAAANDNAYLGFTQPSTNNIGTFFGALKSLGSFLFSNGRDLYMGTIGGSSVNLGTSNITRATITSGGNFGIGTLTPTDKLHVVGGGLTVEGGSLNINNGLVTVANPSSTLTQFIYEPKDNNKTPFFRITPQGTSTYSYGVIANIGSWFSMTSRDFNPNTNSTESIDIVATTGKQYILTRGYGVAPLDLSFGTLDGSTLSEKMIMKVNGNIGIGTISPTSKLQVAGSLSLGYIEKTSAYTLTASDYTVNCTANTFTVTLPTAIGIVGRIYNIKNTGAGTITVAGNGSETIDGNASVNLAQREGIQIQSTNAGWIILK